MVSGDVGVTQALLSTFRLPTCLLQVIEAGRTNMSILYLISGLIALGLFIYLFVALLKPEKFE